jgi:hypothetical protein
MKKSIGLTADISTFNTTLPQTRHLNYFMNTNPRGFAKGGDVSQGIPNYPNPNVTSGFLPMALGFDNGGEADSYFSKLYKAAVKVVAGYLGKDEDDEKVQETAKKFIGTEEGKKIAEQIIQSEQGASSGAPQDTGTPVPVVPMPNTPPPGLTPKDTVTSAKQLLTQDEAYKITPPGGYPGAPSAQSQTTPKIGPNLNTIPGESSGAPQDTAGGIASIEPKKDLPFYLKPLDLNGDGEVNIEDYNIAKETGSKYLDAIAKFLGIIDEKIEEIAKPELKGPNVDIETEIKESEKQEDNKKIKPEDNIKIKPKLKIKPPRDNDGIAGLPKISEEQERRDEQDKRTGLSVEDQKTLKLAANINEGGDGGIETLKNKKDVPAWALPMMSAGFAMMASKSPYFMQALGEAGQAGVESYTAQKTAEEDKLDKQATRDLQKSQAKYYESREQKPDIKILTVDGKGVYHKWDSSIANADGSKGNYVSLNKVAVPSDAEIETELAKIYGERWALIEFKEKQKLINEKKNQYLGIASDNVTSGNKAAQSGGNMFTDWLLSLDKTLEKIAS